MSHTKYLLRELDPCCAIGMCGVDHGGNGGGGQTLVGARRDGRRVQESVQTRGVFHDGGHKAGVVAREGAMAVYGETEFVNDDHTSCAFVLLLAIKMSNSRLVIHFVNLLGEVCFH